MNIKVPFCLLNPVWLGKQKSHVVETSDWKEEPTFMTRKEGKFAQLAFQFYYVFSSQYIPLISRVVIQTCACVLIESLYKSSALSTWDA